jgi:uncharacterized protein YlxP (DUF503 family)
LPKVIPPTNDSDRLKILKQSLVNSEKESLEIYQDPRVTAAILNFAPNFESTYLECCKIQKDRGNALLERNAALDDLMGLLRAYWSALRHMVQYSKMPSSVFIEFGLPLSGKNPNAVSLGQKLMLGKQLFIGHAAMEEAFSDTVLSPKLANIEAAYNVVLAKVALMDEWEVAYSVIQATLANIRKEADNHIDKVISYLHHSMKKNPRSLKRRIMRAHGIKFSRTSLDDIEDDDIDLEDLPEELLEVNSQNPQLDVSNPASLPLIRAGVEPELELVAV